ncbi:MAG: DUF2019 domain-containing protein [Rhizobiales bacterium]|nr:DUF2019 domain-containing protein [Hyphomicrobiales bacterium]
MKKIDLSKFDVSALLVPYVEWSIQQGVALERASISKFNELGGRINQINKELKSRSGDQRGALAPLLLHPNAQVRFNAVQNLIWILPIEARQAIQVIADSGVFPLPGHAGMYLSMHDGEAARILRK